MWRTSSQHPDNFPLLTVTSFHILSASQLLKRASPLPSSRRWSSARCLQAISFHLLREEAPTSRQDRSKKLNLRGVVILGVGETTSRSRSGPRIPKNTCQRKS